MKRFLYIPYFLFHFLFLMLVCSCVFVPVCAAQNIIFEASVNQNTVALGSYVRLTLTATGAQALDPVDLPEIEGVQSRFVGPSSRVSIVNGKYSSSYTFVYDLFPQRTGEFIVPSVTINIEGNDYSTDPITVRVAGKGDSSLQGSEAVASSSVEESLQNRLFVAIKSPREEAYLNEKISIFVRFYIGGLSVRDVEFPDIEHTGFIMDDFEEPKQFTQVIEGIRFNIVEFQTFVYPTRSGDLQLGPVRQRCNVLFKNADRSRRSRGLFDDDFFGGFFNNKYAARSVTLASDPLKLRIHPLPEKGMPEGFSGAVGKFTFNVNISPKDVKVGDPVTIRMKAAGSGSLKTFDLKGFESNQDFKAYDAQVKKEDGVKILEQVLIPQHQDAVLIPEVSFSFFDTEQEEYRTISWGPVRLNVQPLEDGESFKVVGLPDQTGGLFMRRDALGRDISFIKDRLGRVYRIGYRSYRSPLFVVLIFLIIAGWGAGFYFYQFTYKLKTDERFARRLQAPRYARAGLKEAKMFLDKNDAREFYDALFQTMQKYFAHKCHMAPGAVTVDAVLQELTRKGSSNGIGEKLKKVFEQCEASRYASAGFAHDQMARAFHMAQEVIDWFERKF